MEETHTEISSEKFLSFALGDEVYGLDIHKVVEIQRVRNITPIPGSPFFIRGVINLRGKVIPVVDLRLKLGIGEKDYDKNTCIIIINTEENSLIGLVVDTVLEVANLRANELLPSPEFGSSIKNEYLMAFGKLPDGTMLILLDIDKILSVEESQQLKGALPRNEEETTNIKEE